MTTLIIRRLDSAYYVNLVSAVQYWVPSKESSISRDECTSICDAVIDLMIDPVMYLETDDNRGLDPYVTDRDLITVLSRLDPSLADPDHPARETIARRVGRLADEAECADKVRTVMRRSDDPIARSALLRLLQYHPALVAAVDDLIARGEIRCTRVQTGRRGPHSEIYELVAAADRVAPPASGQRT